jgi:hypothetical protein
MDTGLKTEAVAFDISALDATDEAQMVVHSNGRPTSWVWTFAGPGHPKAVDLANKLSRERLRKEAEQEQARVNGRKWKADDEDPDEVAERNADYIVARLIGWSEVQLGGKPYPFSPDNARALLLDPKKGALALQALEFLADQRSFTQRSSTAS